MPKVGDLNVSHKPMDYCDMTKWDKEHPGEEFEDTGVRKWMSGLLGTAACAGGMVDTFRVYHPARYLPAPPLVQYCPRHRLQWSDRECPFTVLMHELGYRLDSGVQGAGG